MAIDGSSGGVNTHTQRVRTFENGEQTHAHLARAVMRVFFFLSSAVNFSTSSPPIDSKCIPLTVCSCQVGSSGDHAEVTVVVVVVVVRKLVRSWFRRMCRILFSWWWIIFFSGARKYCQKCKGARAHVCQVCLPVYVCVSVRPSEAASPPSVSLARRIFLPRSSIEL